MNKSNKRLFIYIVIGVIAFIAIAFGSYKFYKVQAYNKLVNSANKYMDSGNYHQAIAVFNEALKYKEDPNVKRSITLAETLLVSQKYYEEGIKEMENKDYGKAIDSFKKVLKEDAKRYESAQKRIAECIKAYITLNLKNASEAAKNNNYEEANKYLDEVLKVDKENAEAKKLKEDYSRTIIENQQSLESNKVQNSNGMVTAEQAVQSAAKYISNKGENTKFSFDHEESRNGTDYYVIHAFEDMGDHVATLGWYYVEKNGGKVYEWNLAGDELMLLN